MQQGMRRRSVVIFHAEDGLQRERTWSAGDCEDQTGAELAPLPSFEKVEHKLGFTSRCVGWEQ